MNIKRILSEASTTINLYYGYPEWQSIVQNLHRRHHLNPKVVWEEEPIQTLKQLYDKFPRDATNQLERKTYLLIYDDRLVILGKTGPRSVSIFVYNYDTNRGKTVYKYTADEAVYPISDKNPRAVFSTPLNSSQVIKVKSQIPTDTKSFSDESNLIYNSILRFLMPIMNKIIIKALADSEGMIIQYIRSGNYAAAHRKISSLRSLSDIRDALNTSRSLTTSTGITDEIRSALSDSGLYSKLTSAIIDYYEELYPENKISSTKDKIQYLEWLKSIQHSKPDLSNILHHFRERLLR